MAMTDNTHIIIDGGLNITAPNVFMKGVNDNGMLTIKNGNIEIKHLMIENELIMNSGTLKLYYPTDTETEKTCLERNKNAIVQIPKDAILYEGSTPPGETIDTLSYKKSSDVYKYRAYVYIDASSNT